MTWIKCEHVFKPTKEGPSLCEKCGISFRDHTRGFGSNVLPKKRRTRGIRDL